MKYYMAKNGQQFGPMEESELQLNGLTPDTLVWHEGMAQWLPAAQLPELAHLLQPEPPRMAFGEAQPPQPPTQGAWPQPPLQGQPQPQYAPQPQAGGNFSSAPAIVLIVLSVLCCTWIPIVFGILSLSSSSNANKLWAAGNFSAAQAKAAEAKKWNMVGYIVFAVLFVLSVIVGLACSIFPLAEMASTIE